jgi:FKBP-type peptidyl-prolyl cis-trans isomerase
MSMKTAFLAGVAGLALVACGQKEKAAEATKPAEKAATETAAQSAVEGTAPAGAADDSARAAANKSAGEKFLAETAARPGVKSLPSGLLYEVLGEGAAGGAAPGPGANVDIEYVGTKIDGVEFDSSKTQGAAARIPVDAIEGSWMAEALKTMTVGDRHRFYVPAALAYGELGTPGGPIGPNEALIYEIELLKISDPRSTLKAGEAFLAENGKKTGVKTTASGLQYQVLTEGPAGGKSPTDANRVRVHYRGTLIDGMEFDSSYARGAPAEFELLGVIPGWTEGVQLMSVGDKYRFFVPSKLAYGETGAGGAIGPNEALIFEVELLDVLADQPGAPAPQ